MACSLFGTKVQKSFGYTFPRFIDKGEAGNFKITIDAVGSYAFRIRYAKSNEIINETLMAPKVPKGEDALIAENENVISVSIGDAELKINKKPFHISFLSKIKKTLVEIPGIDTAHPNASGAGGFASLKDFYPFGMGDGLATFTTKMKLNEKIFGLGEKFVGIDRRGQHLETRPGGRRSSERPT